MKNLNFLDLLIAALLAIFCMIVALAGISLLVVKAVTALLLVLVLPGFAFFTAVFPKRSPFSAESLLLISGSSMAITLLSGLSLALLQVKLAPKPWALGLGGFVLVGCSIAFLRRLGGVEPVSWPHLARLQWRSVGLLAASALLCAGAVSLASSPITDPVHLQGYTLLWILPAANGNPGGLRVGVVSAEFQPTSYTLLLTVNGRIVQSWQNLTLAPGASWETTLKEMVLSGTAPVQAFLYKAGNLKVIYRQVKLFPGP